MLCNIDARGARIRLVWGILNLIAAALAAAAAIGWHLWWPWIVAGLCAAAGIFALFEARKKWCVMRALGIKTPL
jgi:hypothetical protein